jgi:tRNA threonylcarbamoyladenosine biosynthesis protein TsaE
LKERTIVFETRSEQETVRLGERLGGLLFEGDVIALEGDLGSGKTRFAQGLAVGLGVKRGSAVASPTFALVHEYEGRCAFFHMDAYRLERRGDFIDAGLEEYFHAGGVAAQEWADRWPELLPAQRVRVVFSFLENGRRLAFSGSEPRALEILAGLEAEARAGRNLGFGTNGEEGAGG